MNPDDPVCLCFHVTRRKVVNFIRVEKPRRPSQLSECFGAGTGCGWCRPYLERILEDSNRAIQQPASPASSADQDSATENSPPPVIEMTAQQYRKARSAYVRKGGGTPPPGATPIDPIDQSSDQ